MTKVSRIWLWLFLIFVGFSGGIVVGVIVDVDEVYHTTVKKIKQKNSSGEIVIDVEVGDEPEKTKKELREEKRKKRRADREINRAERKNN